MYNSPSSDVIGKQPGAIEAMTNNISRTIFRKYDWVVRLNPDVRIHSFDEVYKYMTWKFDAIVGSCRGRVMTDFTVFRPRIFDTPLQPFKCPYKVVPNAECEMTHLVQNAKKANRLKIAYNTTERQCRTLWKNVVTHHHKKF
jgi:hypothetical protein